MKRIILCGGSGYIGTKLTQVLIDKTDYELVIIDRLDFKLNSEFKQKYYDLDRVTFHQKDIRDLEFMKDVLQSDDYVVNLAALVGEPLCKIKPEEAVEVNFEAAKNISLEELNENTCKYMEGHPDEKSSSFCGRKTIEKFSYCPLHLMMVFQPKGKKEDVGLKDDEVPVFLEKKVKSA